MRDRRIASHTLTTSGRRRRPTFIAAHRVIIAIAVVIAIIVLALWQVHALESSIPSTCHYHARGSLPDPTCTPGAVTSFTTQQICSRHYPTRPPTSYTTPLKRRLIQSYGAVYGTSTREYELDHLVPLELGGNPTSVKNLWPEPWTNAHAKDLKENSLHRSVCNSTMTLKHAQFIMSHDWRK